MAWKDKDKQRAAIRKHYRENKQYYIDKAKRQKRNLKEKIYKLKESTPCTDCGQHYPHFVMDYDHLENKRASVSSLLNRGGPRKVMEEIKKCELVCANCHRIRTHSRKQSYTI
ncbi:MAG: hypothetical protein AAF413_03605 [Patescibacteria group bacterium]